ncbi:MACPF domain-containing protein At4g24290 [Linum perenne]
MALRLPAPKAAEFAIGSIGLGYDIAVDLRLKYRKGDVNDSRLIEIDEDGGREIVLSGGIVIPNVPKSIKCDKGERTRFRSDVLSFQQMSEQFNQEMSLTGKIPSGLFNTMFEFSSCWQKDAANTKTLSFDGVFITLYSVALEKSHIVLCDHVKKAVPSSWEPAALAKFIETFGTHIIVGVKMGGKDVIYIKQQHSSTLQTADLQKRLKEMADKRFSDVNGHTQGGAFQSITRYNLLQSTFQNLMCMSCFLFTFTSSQDITRIYKRRGGNDSGYISHSEWLNTVQVEPDVISMSFIPITSLLNGVPGSGFLSHAINLYLRYKPPIEELHQFLEFQLPRQWAPVFSELPLGPQRRQHSSASLQFSFMGPKLFVNTIPVDVGQRPVTGLRLYLEGRRCNRLAIHIQHLSSLPKIFQLKDDPNGNFRQDPCDRKYYEKVQWKNFSHVCTAPVESDEDLSIVTGAQLQVENSGFKSVLFLRLRFSTVSGAAVRKNPEWDGSPGLAAKSGLISTLISHHFTSVAQKPAPRPAVQAPRLLKFVDTTEMARGPQDNPGYWVVSGAKLVVEKGRISLRVKYSLLTILSDDDDSEVDHLG